MKIPFNIKQGLSTELRNQSLVEGTMYYCTDTNEFYIDVKDPNNNNVLTRFCLNDSTQFAPASHNHDDRYYTESESNKNYYRWERGALDIDTRYDMKLSMLAKGLNLPDSNGYGVCLTMPYRESTGNSKPDFGAQIFVPNGDDDVYPNSMFYRTALSNTWNDWQEVATVAQLNQKAPAYTYGTTDLVEGQSTLPVGTLYFVFEE